METVLLADQQASEAAQVESAVAISIIVPCWRGDVVPDGAAARWLEHAAVCEILVAAIDGDVPTTSDDTPRRRKLICTRHGRGNQMNEAAKVARGDVLLFHHADTELNTAHLESLSAAMASNPEVVGGAFRRQFDERHPHLRWLEPWEAFRCRCFGPLFGDQSIFVRRAVFGSLGGFADIPLMEDVEFSCRMRRAGRITLLAPSIRSSARKHLQRGRWRTTLMNALFLFLYVCRVSPSRLHALYYRRPYSGESVEKRN